MVTEMDEWPRWTWTALGLAPAAISRLAQVWRRSWILRPSGTARRYVGLTCSDRLGRLYDSAIRPDELVLPTDHDTDPVLSAGTSWLTSQDNCAL